MTVEYPLLMLPEPSEQDKGGRPGFGSPMHRPSVEVQGKRLSPKLTRLANAFDSKRIRVQTNPDGMEPELALVFEVAGSLSSFFGAVTRIDGLDWLFDIEDDEMLPDEYFYPEEDADSSFSGRVYCVMSDRKAFDQLMGIWEKYQMDNEYAFPRGLTSLRELFCLLRDVHAWGPKTAFWILASWIIGARPLKSKVCLPRPSRSNYSIEAAQINVSWPPRMCETLSTSWAGVF